MEASEDEDLIRHILQIVRESRTGILGSQLAEKLDAEQRRTLKSVHGGLAKFVSAKIPAVTILGYSGADPIFGEPGWEPPPAPRFEARAWRVWTSPASRFRLAVSAQGGVRLVAQGSFLGSDEHVLESLTGDQHRQIARAFLAAHPHVAEVLEASITPDAGWWTKWNARVEHLGLETDWFGYRERALEDRLHGELRALGLSEDAVETARNQIVASRGARGSAPTRRRSAQSRAELLGMIGRALQTLGEDELRRIWLPIGAILDAMKAEERK